MSAAPAPARAVLFDLDGVLIDSYEGWFRVVDATTRALGGGPTSRERFHSIWGQGIAADLRTLYPGRTREEVEASYVREWASQTAAIDVNPEAVPTLRGLRDAGLRLACVTNTQLDLARTVLRAAGLLDLFDDVQGARPGVREKPAPDLLLAALARLGVAPADAWMVGDSVYDEEGARAAGVPFLLYDSRTGASLRAAVEGRARPAE